MIVPEDFSEPGPGLCGDGSATVQVMMTPNYTATPLAIYLRLLVLFRKREWKEDSVRVVYEAIVQASISLSAYVFTPISSDNIQQDMTKVKRKREKALLRKLRQHTGLGEAIAEHYY